MPAYEAVEDFAPGQQQPGCVVLDTAMSSQLQQQPNDTAVGNYDSMGSQQAPPAADASLKQFNLTAVYGNSSGPTGSIVLDRPYDAEADDDYSLAIDAGVVASGTSATSDGVYSTATDMDEETVPRRPPRAVAYGNDKLPRLPPNLSGLGHRRSLYNGFDDAEDA